MGRQEGCSYQSQRSAALVPFGPGGIGRPGAGGKDTLSGGAPRCDAEAAQSHGCASDAGCFQGLPPPGTYPPNVADFFLIAARCRVWGYWCIGKRGGYGHQRAKDFASWSPHGVRIPINTAMSPANAPRYEKVRMASHPG